MTHDEFISKESNRQRYWARSTVGWGWFSKAQFNDAHKALAELERSRKVSGIITQNVDMLHQAAGSSAVIDLHGVNSRVVCLQCGELSSRHKLQAQLAALNADWLSQQQEVLQLHTDDRAGNAVANTSSPRVRADGDVELESHTDSFNVCPCERCGGVLKPDVVFFGDRCVDTAVTYSADAHCITQCAVFYF
jgi:NAD-dependent SIR2 family protein deacetylase